MQVLKEYLEAGVGIEPAYTALQAACWNFKSYSYPVFPLVLPLRSV